jgi:hypothetical protein
MYKSLIFVGIILIVAGAIVLSNTSIPHVTFRLIDFFNLFQISNTYSSITFIVVGVLLMFIGAFHSEMGKYFKFY